ncbi:Uncharacterized protein conserved in bacteria [uncultured Clostridium sp.]|uniref:Tim44 domain-containing protein n=1 Tax=uncultured Clostridium sp. TaxID=59620 RepID=UPI0008207635|nr:Tim44-like domain-containing protein [uncultured Clostridium sp.]SCK04600.1 Uncharacterized protein conserved in bacteria [uncultured Clostridium sp.]
MKKLIINKILIIFIIVTIFSIPVIAFARPGGGSGGSSGGSGGSGGGSAHSSTRGNGNGRTNPIASIINFGVFMVIGSTGAIVYRVKVSKKKKECVTTIKSLADKDDNWDYENIKNDIQEVFDKVGIAWIEMDQELARGYVSEKLFENHRMKLEWMKIRKERNIIEGLTLLKITVLGLEDRDGIDRDVLWASIKATSIDYTINEETKQIIKGDSSRPIGYEEYWRFIKTPERWVLDEIKQVEEIENLEFFKISIDN